MEDGRNPLLIKEEIMDTTIIMRSGGGTSAKDLHFLYNYFARVQILDGDIELCPSKSNEVLLTPYIFSIGGLNKVSVKHHQYDT